MATRRPASRVFGYDGAPGAPKKRKSARLASRLTNAGLAETRLGSVTPIDLFPGITGPQVLAPDYTQRLVDLEGTRGSPANLRNPTCWLKHTDGKYGLLSYRANLGAEDLKESDGITIAERGLNVLNMHKSKVKGDSTFIKNIHLKTRIKYVNPEPGVNEQLNAGTLPIHATQFPPAVRVRMLVVRVKRDKLGLPMYGLDGDRSHHDNPVGSNLFLDPIGRDFGINQEEYATGTNLSTAHKPQTPMMHFKCPVQKKFFTVLATKDFMLSPAYSQPKYASKLGALDPPIHHTGLDYPDYQDINLTIPINENVEYVPAHVDKQFSGANTNFEQLGNENYMVTPKDLNIFDTKIIIYACAPGDTMETWSDRLLVYDNYNQPASHETFSGCPHIMFDYYGVLETVDNQ
jgi:hypothetical protein